jgi:hypothetical protein
MSYECSDEGTCTQNIRNSSTPSHPSEEENRTKIEIFLCLVIFRVELIRKDKLREIPLRAQNSAYSGKWSLRSIFTRKIL